MATLSGCEIIHGMEAECLETTTLHRGRTVQVDFYPRHGYMVCRWCPVRDSPVGGSTRVGIISRGDMMCDGDDLVHSNLRVDLRRRLVSHGTSTICMCGWWPLCGDVRYEI